ncbi:MAG: phospholipid carrier-dependent glycosyltransferase, partial [Chloroflexi bacterium]
MSQDRKHRQSLIWIILILLVAAVLRLYGLNNISPPGIEHDEVANWLIDRSILAGNHAIYFTRAYGHEAGFHYIQTAFVALLGDNVLALRLPAAFAGLLGVAVSFTLVRKLFGRDVALISTALLATLFWPVFYSRLGLRAILLPVFSGLSAYFFVCGGNLIQRDKGTKGQRREEKAGNYFQFILAGLFAGLSIHTYMAARAVPIFYGLFVIYLVVWQRDLLREKWRGVVWFTAVFAITASPLVIYLFTNPGAEFRIEEVSAPLTALLAGDVGPVLENGVKIIGMFGWAGDPLWRQNVAGMPVFEPVVAVLFYVGVVVALWRWKDGRFAFILLWLATSTIPSLVTIDAPSTIRIINALPVLTVFPALLIHILSKLSTDNPQLSTDVSKIVLGLALTVGAVYANRTVQKLFVEWPTGGDVPFVWQAAFSEAAVALNTSPTTESVAIGGWSPDTMDPKSFDIILHQDAAQTSHFNPEDGTLILPAVASGEQVIVIRPFILELHPYWEQQLVDWGADIAVGQHMTQYGLNTMPDIQPEFPADVLIGNQLRFLGYDFACVSSCQLISYWQVEAEPTHATRLFVHLLDEEGTIQAENYRLDNLDPQSLWFPHWQRGDLILQIH